MTQDKIIDPEITIRGLLEGKKEYWEKVNELWISDTVFYCINVCQMEKMTVNNLLEYVKSNVYGYDAEKIKDFGNSFANCFKFITLLLSDYKTQKEKIKNMISKWFDSRIDRRWLEGAKELNLKQVIDGQTRKQREEHINQMRENIEIVIENDQRVLEYLVREFRELEKFYEQYSQPPEKIDFKAIKEAVDRVESIPIERTIAKHQMDLFPHPQGIKKVEEVPLEDGGRYVVYKKEKGQGEVKYSFKLPDESKYPTFSRNTWQVYLGLNLYALAEKTLNPIIPTGDFIKRLGNDHNLYTTIKECFRFLTMATYEIRDRQKRTWEIGHIVNYAKEFNEGTKDSFYLVRLAPEYHKHLEAMILGKEKEIPAYIKYPIQALLEYKDRESGLFNLILQHRGQKKIYPYTIKTLLTKGIGLTDKEIKTKSMRYFAQKLDEGLRELREYGFEWCLYSFGALKNKIPKAWQIKEEDLYQMGFVKMIDKIKNIERDYPIDKYKALYPEGRRFNKADFLGIKIFFKEIKGGDKPEDIEALTQQITEWHLTPGFGVKKSKEDIKKQVRATIKKYGVSKIQQIFEKVSEPLEFWNEIKWLKMKLNG